MKKISNKLIILSLAILAVGAGVAVAFLDEEAIKSTEKDSNIAFVAGTDGKMWYIKSKDCSEEVYKNTDSKDIFDTMCRAYTTDGKFVYYDGMREILLPPMIAPFTIDGKIASSSMPSPVRKQGPMIIEGADIETFEIISSDYLAEDLNPEQNPTLTYARDKNFLYRYGEKVEGADPNTLLILGRGYIKDKNAIYFRGKKLEGIDLDTFEFLKYGFARDKNFVYLMWQNNKKIEGSSGATFEVIDADYAKDSNFVYYKKKKLDGADPSTFEFVYNIYTADGLISTTPSGYVKDNNFLYYKGERVEGADTATFEIIGFNGIHAKDKNFIYAPRAEKLLWIDAKTFKVVSNSYFKDKNAVYFGEGKIIENADPKTFEALGGIYIKDKNFVWRSNYIGHGGSIGSVSKIEGADSETFEFLEYGYAKDKNFVYLNADILLGIDSLSVEILSNEYLKDKNSVYLRKEKLQDADPATFEVINYNYTKDKNAVYFRGDVLKGVNPNYFEFFRCGYIKDNLKVFFLGRNEVLNIINGADATSFEVISRTCYAKDDDFVYFIDAPQRGRSDFVKIEGADPETFELVASGYMKDLSSVYYKGARIEGADPKTFEVIDSRYTKDKNLVYYTGLKIIGVDVKTFEIMRGGNYSKDSLSAYYKGKLIEGADVNTFEFSGFQDIARDKNTLYQKGAPITKDEFLNKDIIIPPGFAVPNAVLPPFGLEAVEIQEIYPAGL